MDPLDKGEGLEELLNVKLPKQILRMILLLKKLGDGAQVYILGQIEELHPLP